MDPIPTLSTIEGNPPQPLTDAPEYNLEDFSFARGPLNQIITAHDKVKQSCLFNRQLRYSRDIDGTTLRRGGQIRIDEGYYPIRLIDSKIRKEQPPYYNYITKSRRSAIFSNVDGTAFPGSDLLEAAFTNTVRFQGWETPFFRWIDGTQAHGYDILEVVFDPSMPGHFGFEHVGKENLCLPEDAESLQAQEILARRVNLTAYQLRQMVKTSGFDSSQVESVIKANPDKQSQYHLNTVEIYKVMFRKDDVIKVAWYYRTCTDWLKKPEPLFLGRGDVTKPKQLSGEMDELGNPIMEYPPIPEVEYPYVLFRYVESEDPKIHQLQGRARTDETYQEAATILHSAFVNQSARAANMIASPVAMPGNVAPSSAPKQLEAPLKNGSIFDRPMKFDYMPSPPLSNIQAINNILQISYQEDSQVNYAAQNREDTEKTATELLTAREESDKLSSIQVMTLSIAIREVMSKAWKIYQNRVAQGLITISQQLIPLFYTQNSPVALGQEGTIVLAIYSIKSSGDVDVVQKAEH